MKLLPLVPEESIPGNQLVTPVIHKCQIDDGLDEVDKLIPGSGIMTCLKRYLVRRCILSKQHPTAKLCIKSSASINYEINRHITYHPWIIHPFSDMRILWNIFMSLFTFICLIFIPFILAFYFNHQGYWFNILLIINIIFTVDTISYFFMGYFDSTTRAVILERKVIVCKYLQMVFILNILSGFPFEIFYFVWKSFYSTGEIKWYWTCMNLLKIIRIRNLIVATRKLYHLYQVSFRICKIVEMVMILIIGIHWAACLELYVPLVTHDVILRNSQIRSWLPSDYTRNDEMIFKKYITSLNRAIIALMGSTHYLPVQTTEDIIFNLFLTILGRIGFIYILGQFFQLMTTFDSTRKRNVKELQEFHEYMKYKELPKIVQGRLFAYYRYYQKSFDRDKLIINQVSPNLREELLLHNYREMLEQVELFKYLPRSMKSQTAMLVKNEMYSPNDIIIKYGTVEDCLYYLTCGTVSIMNNNEEEICKLQEGSYFGEAALIIENEKHRINVKALEICEFSIIKRSDFLNLITPHKTLLTRLQKLALTKLEKLNKTF